MGQGISTEARLSAHEIYKYCAKGFTVAEVEYSFRRYRALKAPILSENYASRDLPYNLPDPNPKSDTTKLSQVTKGKAPAQKNGKIYVDTTSETPLFAEQLKLDWLLARVFYSIFSEGKEVSFDQYMEKMREWKAYTTEDRIKYPVIFKILDHNQDGLITASDLTIFIANILHHKFAVNDHVRIRTDNNTAGQTRTGQIRYIGHPDFAPPGILYAGLELDTPTGKHNGAVKGTRYFTCADSHGIFVPFSSIDLADHYTFAQELCDQIAGVVNASVQYEKFRDVILADSSYCGHLDNVQIGL